MHQGAKRTARFRKVLSRNIFDTEQPEDRAFAFIELQMPHGESEGTRPRLR
jgi:hypothetical protein